ncbi:hypothetical protein PPGU16_57750 (plasmid) [Paraburkholderia largidicola]|uniref:Uncharacterized protein n=1 Tax=Paraburkholderia largidicola TaxID=3014751 RepID=A0A7I8BWN6_9BURK|nr:hypothetical protein PPGU16_57750 [Paraburkholderia sp. PGU16]
MAVGSPCIDVSDFAGTFLFANRPNCISAIQLPVAARAKMTRSPAFALGGHPPRYATPRPCWVNPTASVGRCPIPLPDPRLQNSNTGSCDGEPTLFIAAPDGSAPPR